MARFLMRIAGKLVEVHSLHDQVRKLCADYIVEDGTACAACARNGSTAAGDAADGVAANGGYAGVPDLVVCTSQADIDRERDEAGYSDAYLETLAVYRQIAEWAPTQALMLMHGAVVEFSDRAYMFTAPSGTGKSTHVRLWRKHLGDAVRIINGDKPLVAVPTAGVDANADASAPVAFGTPWAGKEGWQRNASAPLAGICFLEQGEANAVARIDPSAAFDDVMRQVYLPADGAALLATMDMLDALLSHVPLFRLTCDMSEDAVRCSFEGVTGLRYDDFRKGARDDAR